MPSSLAKRMEEACATDLRQLKRATFPDEPTSLHRTSRLPPAQSLP